MNDLMDLEWLVQRRITHSVKYEKLTTKRRGISKEVYEQQEKTRLKHAAGRRQLGAKFQGLTKKVETYTVFEGDV